MSTQRRPRGGAGAPPAAHAAVKPIGASPEVVALVAEAFEHARAARVPQAVETLDRITFDDPTTQRLRRRLGPFHLKALTADGAPADQAGRERLTTAVTSLAALVGATASMHVRVGNRGYDTGYQGVWVTTVVIAACCPRCDRPRGVPYDGRIVEDGEYLHVHNWDNPCGHRDQYADVLVEAGFHPPRATTSAVAEAGG